MIQYIPTILIVSGMVAAWLRAALPLVSLLPERFQWVPGAVLTSVGMLSALDGVPNEGQAIAIVIAAVSTFVHAATPGHKEGAAS